MDRKQQIVPRVILLLLLGVISLPSCKKEIEIPVKYQPKMVLTGVLVPDRNVEIMLTSNYPSTDTATVKPIKNATVELYSGSELLGTLTHADNGIYTLETKIDAGGRYTLKAHCEGYPSIEASTTLPLWQGLGAMRYLTEDKEYNIINQRLIITSTPTDALSYYAIFFYHHSYSDYSPWFDGSDMRPSYYDFPVKMPEDGVEFFGLNGMKTHNAFSDFTNSSHTQYLDTYFPDGRKSSFTWGFSSFYFSNDVYIGKPRIISFHRLDNYYEDTNNTVTHINLYQLSPELYKAFRGIAAQESTKEKVFLNPVPAYNTIEGGLGYFGGCLVHEVRLSDVTVWE